jgi:DNA-directed RNA polymerase specialized sigma24 family protein
MARGLFQTDERFGSSVTWMDGMNIDFDDWYCDQRPRVYVSMLALSRDADLAAEVTDEAFTRAVAHWKRVRTMDAPGGWVYRVAVNVLRRRMRRRGFERRVLLRLASNDVIAGPDGSVWDAVDALAARQRTAVVLRYVAQLTEPEIAQVMGVARGTVASTLAAARSRLAEMLVDLPEEEAS